MSEEGAALSVRNVSKSYGDKVVLKNISFDVKPGEFVVLVGPSGCGKSTMLRSIAGLEDIQGGEIDLNNRMISGLAPKDRDIAMVFQDYALYPHKNVYENIAFGLKIRKMDPALIDQRVQEAATKLNLTELLERRPAALSGGQRQRVAIGRAIVRQPKAFLFDEPLSNLDAKLRGSMRIEISKLHHDLNATVLYVTHDQIEAMTLADRIIVFNDGRIQQMGTPLDLYYHPNNVFVATFIGSPSMNLILGKFVKSTEGWAYRSEEGIEFRLSREQISELANEPQEGREILWGIRPENMVFDADDEKGDLEFKAKVLITEPHGPTTYIICDIMGHEVQVMLPEPHRPARGDVVPLKFASKHLYLFDKSTGERA